MLETLRGLTFVDWLNAAIAAAIVVAAFCAVRKMTEETQCEIVAAFVTASIGIAGYLFGTFWPGQWQKPFDTLFLGGVLALVIGTRRHTDWVPPSRIPRISLGVSFTSWAVFFIFIR